MRVTLPLDKMTTEEKLCVLEEVWDNLAQAPGKVGSPSWHGEELAVREERLSKGLTRFSDWSEAKQRILGRIR